MLYYCVQEQETRVPMDTSQAVMESHSQLNFTKKKQNVL